jgi:hypothetical protein
VAKKKSPKTNFSGQAVKTAKAQVPASSQQQKPHFCFQHADRATQEAWKFRPSGEHAPGLVDFICEMARLTWAEIEAQRLGSGANRHKRHHSQEVRSLVSAAQADVTKRKLSEKFDDSMFRFRLNGEQRLWGFRRQHVFHVVWWDPEHKVYPTEKKRT